MIESEQNMHASFSSSAEGVTDIAAVTTEEVHVAGGPVVGWSTDIVVMTGVSVMMRRWSHENLILEVIKEKVSEANSSTKEVHLPCTYRQNNHWWS